MKKFLTIVAVLVLAFALTACSSGDKDTSTGNSDSGSNSSKTDADGKTSSDSNTGKNDDKTVTNDSGDNGSGSNQDRPERNTGMNRTTMEKKIASYLSEIGGPDEISICDAESFTYKSSGDLVMSMYGDEWNLYGVKTTKSELFASLDKQLIENCGFQKDSDLMGQIYFKRAGSKKIGIIVSCYSEDDTKIDYLTIWMSHASECYSQDYIKQQEAIMPDIIPAANALEILPENYCIEVDYGYMKVRYARKDGNYYYGYLYAVDENGSQFCKSEAYIKNSNGGYDRFTSSSMDGKSYEDGAAFESDDPITEDALNEKLHEWYDFDGYEDNGNLSTWGQMSADYRDGVTLMGANSRFTISATLEKIGTENIAGVECAVCKDKGAWTQHSFAYDPKTGILFRVIRYENDTEEVLMKVTAYSDNPDSLGNYKG